MVRGGCWLAVHVENSRDKENFHSVIEMSF